MHVTCGSGRPSACASGVLGRRSSPACGSGAAAKASATPASATATPGSTPVPASPATPSPPDNPLVADGTWPLERGRRIDYVLVRCRDHGPSLDITACALVFDQPVGGVWASGHFGVVADLTVAPPEPMVPG
jgi:hypothetical protein